MRSVIYQLINLNQNANLKLRVTVRAEFTIWLRRSLLVREVWGSNLEPIKSPIIRCQRLATVVTLIVWAMAQSRGDGHRSLVSPERVLSEYNEDLIFLILRAQMEADTSGRKS